MSKLILCCLLGFGVGLRQANAKSSGLCSNYSTADEIARGQSLAHRVAIVTGGDSGLGYETAKTMAKHGATVVIASHNLAKCQTASRSIMAAVGGNVVGMTLDLSSFASVRNFTTQFLKDYTVLNYLINNAGINHARSPDKTEDGFEEIFQVNYLGHFLLTELLLPILRNNRGFSPARIVNTASYAHYWTCQLLNVSEGCLKDWTFFPPPVSSQGPRSLPNTYGLSKLAQIEHAAQLSVREANNSIQAFSVGPGWVNTTINARNETDGCDDTQTPCPYTPEQGAAVIAACALTATHAGGWYVRNYGCSEDLPVMTHGFTTAMQPKLYDLSLQWVGLVTGTNTLVA